jgi:hypothetical protein
MPVLDSNNEQRNTTLRHLQTIPIETLHLTIWYPAYRTIVRARILECNIRIGSRVPYVWLPLLYKAPERLLFVHHHNSLPQPRQLLVWGTLYLSNLFQV